MPHVDPAFVAVRRILPDDARAELDTILVDARDNAAWLDELAIAGAILKARIAKALRALPDLPARLAEIAREDQGRWFESNINVNPTSEASVLAAHSMYLAECRAVAALVSEGRTISDAWVTLRRRLGLDIIRRRKHTRTGATPVVAPAGGDPPRP